jgi:hypothetical protein
MRVVHPQAENGALPVPTHEMTAFETDDQQLLWLVRDRMWQQLVTVALFGALLYRADALSLSGKRCSRISWAHLAFLCAISLRYTSRASECMQ